MDTSLRQATDEQRARFFLDATGWTHPGETVTHADPQDAMEAMEGRYLLHLPVDLPDARAVMDLAAQLCASLAWKPLRAWEMTVSAAATPQRTQPVYCQRTGAHGNRCRRRFGHDGACLLPSLVTETAPRQPRQPGPAPHRRDVGVVGR